MAKKKEEGIEMLMTAPSNGLTVPSSFKIGDQTINRETLIKQRNEDVKLVITGIDDVKGYKQAIAFRASYRTLRTTLEKVRKEHFKPLQDYLKDYKAKTDELGSEAAIGEEYFDNLITAIDDEKERIKQEAIIAEQKRIQGRINEMAKLGSTFDGENYTFSYAPGVCLSVTDLAKLDEKGWTCFIEELTEDFNKEQTRIENERLAKEQANLLITQQAEQNKQDALALTEKRTKLREKELTLMGFVLNDDPDESTMYLHPTGEFAHMSIIESISDENWENMVVQMEKGIANALLPVGTSISELIEAAQTTENIDVTPMIGEDNICPLTKQPCDDETCSSGSECNVSGSELSGVPVTIEPDYSLNEFEKFIEQYFKGTAKVKQQFLLAISEYKELMNKI